MNFVVSARKWRPVSFAQVIGQEHITTTLKNAIKNNRVAHAYLFAGPRGVGKTTTARILAKALNCLHPVDADPCNECEMCLSAQTSQSLDIIEIDGASNRRIEEIRQLRESVKYAPTIGRYKVYIIDEVHMLTNESFNALLKTLEEPPEHTIFIFATTDVHKVPLTIISRCQRFDFRRIQLEQIKSVLLNIAKNEKITIDDKTLTTIAKKADGALRDAESLFDQVASFCGVNIEFATVSKMLNLIDDDIYFDLSDAILGKRYITAFDSVKRIYDNGWNFIDFMNGLTEHFRNILAVIVSGKADMIEAADIYHERYMKYKESFTESDLLRILQYLNKSFYELKNTANQKLKMELILSHLVGLERSSSISELLGMLGKTPAINIDAPQKPKAIEPASKSEDVKKNSEPAPIIKPSAEPTPVPMNPAPPAAEKKEVIEEQPKPAPLAKDNKTLWQEVKKRAAGEKYFLGVALNQAEFSLNHQTAVITYIDSASLAQLNDNEKFLKQIIDELFEGKFHLEFKKSANAPAIEPDAETELVKAVKDILKGQELR